MRFANTDEGTDFRIASKFASLSQHVSATREAQYTIMIRNGLSHSIMKSVSLSVPAKRHPCLIRG